MKAKDEEERFPGFGAVIAAVICGLVVIVIAAGFALVLT